MRKFRKNFRSFTLALLFAIFVGTVSSAYAKDDISEFRVGSQQGLIYLPLYVIEDQNLLEKYTVQLGGAPTKLRLIYLGSASAISEMLLSGGVHAVAGAITPLLTLWDKTRGAQKVKAIASLSNSVLYLNANETRLRSLRDFTEKDRIALSGVGFSMQATLLQMASAQAFGEGKEKQLDALTVSMPHPEGLAALMSGNAQLIAAHFTTSPFQNIELRDPRIHRMLTSTDILGGYAPAGLIFTTQNVYETNRQMLEAFVAALDEANSWISRNSKEAAELYLRKEPQKLTVDEVKELLLNVDTKFSTMPENSLKIAKFMARLGRLHETPENWRDYFFPIVNGNGG